MPSNLDPIQTDVSKQKFLESLWTAQATYRARAGHSVILRADEQEIENRSGRITLARTYFNVYQRTAFLQEPKKVCLLNVIGMICDIGPNLALRPRSWFILTR
jgi:hypothetical protein